MYYAQIDPVTKIVTSVTEVTTELVGDHLIQLESYDVSIMGKMYDVKTSTFRDVPPPAIRKLSKLQYMDRFTDAELAGIYTLAKSVVEIEIWLERFKQTSEIDLDDPRVQSGLMALEASGLIGSGRATEILS